MQHARSRGTSEKTSPATPDGGTIKGSPRVNLPPSAPSNIPDGAGRRVLVVDDEPAIRRFIKAALEDSGYQVVGTGTGAAAVTLFREAATAGRPFHAVLLDLTIAGGMGGRETLAELRAIDPAVRAIASSGYASGDIMDQPRAHGFVGTLAKPYSMDELERAVADACRAP